MNTAPWDCIQPLDEKTLAQDFQRADPFPHFQIDDFLAPEVAEEVAASYPDYEDATKLGQSFSALNENLKVQICDRARFPDPVRRMEEALSSKPFLAALERITGIPHLLADAELFGGGMHVMGSGGRLDVHVDFNLIEERQLHRRLNILVFMNPVWREDWGGKLELWDSAVRERGRAITPAFNRCAVFETSEISYHGVTPIACPAERTRNSFAAYYYTREAPEGWDGSRHSTVFRARPDEQIRGRLLMPMERMRRDLRHLMRRLRRKSAD